MPKGQVWQKMSLLRVTLRPQSDLKQGTVIFFSVSLTFTNHGALTTSFSIDIDLLKDTFLQHRLARQGCELVSEGYHNHRRGRGHQGEKGSATEIYFLIVLESVSLRLGCRGAEVF